MPVQQAAAADASQPTAVPATGWPHGLSAAEAARRLADEGANELPHERRRGTFSIALSVLREPMFLMLVAAGALYLAVGDPADALMLLGFVCVVMGITIVQERRTERSLEALRDLSSPRALVIRDGVQKRIAGVDVARGDVIVIVEGDRVAYHWTMLWPAAQGELKTIVGITLLRLADGKIVEDRYLSDYAKSEDTTEENKALIRRWVAARNANDLEAALQCWSAERQEWLRNAFGNFSRGFPDIHLEIEDLVAERDEVLMRVTLTGTHLGVWSEIAPTGKKVAWRFVDTYTIVDGKIASMLRVAPDLKAMLRA